MGQANKPNKIQSQNCPIINPICLQDLLVAKRYNLIKSWHGEGQCSLLLCLQFFGFHTGSDGLKMLQTGLYRGANKMAIVSSASGILCYVDW